MSGGTSGGAAVPGFVMDWLEANPQVVRNWMTDPDFRESVLADPSQHIQGPNSSQVLEWVEERIRAHGTDKLLGNHPGNIVAM